MRRMLAVFLVLLAFGLAQTRVVLGVGGKTAVIYLPLTVTERLGFFREEGLDVVIQDFGAGARALQALIGGSVEVVAGGYDHTIQMQALGRDIVAFVLLNRYPGLVLAVRKDLESEIRSISDLKGRRVGVTAPGSSTHIFVNYLLIKSGLRPTDVSIVSTSVGAQAVAAVQNRLVDAISNVEPAISLLSERGLIRVLADTRTAQGTRAVLGGEYPFASLYTTRAWLERNPDKAQRLTNAMVRGLRWMQGKTPEEIAAVLPEEYFLGDRALYLKVLKNSLESFSPNGRFSDTAPLRPLTVLSAFDPNVARARIDLKRTYTNAFVDRALKMVK
jgi:NitT/TauT family transport system substrate-binding protein